MTAAMTAVGRHATQQRRDGQVDAEYCLRHLQQGVPRHLLRDRPGRQEVPDLAPAHRDRSQDRPSSVRSDTSTVAIRADRRSGSRCAAITPSTRTPTARSTPPSVTPAACRSATPPNSCVPTTRRHRTPRDEDHVGYKIAWENGIVRTRTVNGQLQTFDLSCDALTVLHQETYSAESYASNLHEVLYAIDCSRGTDAGASAARSSSRRWRRSAIPASSRSRRPTMARLPPCASARRSRTGFAGWRCRARPRDTDGGQRLRRRARSRSARPRTLPAG